MTDPTPEQLDKDIEWYAGKPNVATYDSLYKEYQRTLEKLEIAREVLNGLGCICAHRIDHPLLQCHSYDCRSVSEALKKIS